MSIADDEVINPVVGGANLVIGELYLIHPGFRRLTFGSGRVWPKKYGIYIGEGDVVAHHAVVHRFLSNGEVYWPSFLDTFEHVST